MPRSRKRPRHSAAIRGATFSAVAICLFLNPSPANSTMRLRNTTRLRGTPTRLLFQLPPDFFTQNNRQRNTHIEVSSSIR
jgi:hypothetical protein